MEFMMHEGMDGPHLFEVPVQTNDPKQQLVKLEIKSNWVKGN